MYKRQALLNRTNGWVDYFLGLLGLGQPVWLADSHTAMLSVVIADAWTGIPVVGFIVLAGLLSLPRDPVEAALVDGTTALPVSYTHLDVYKRQVSIWPTRSRRQGIPVRVLWAGSYESTLPNRGAWRPPAQSRATALSCPWRGGKSRGGENVGRTGQLLKLRYSRQLRRCHRCLRPQLGPQNEEARRRAMGDKGVGRWSFVGLLSLKFN